MKPIKVSIFGADGYTCQVPRIKEGMQSLGHFLTEESPELINESPYDFGWMVVIEPTGKLEGLLDSNSYREIID